MKQTTSRKLCRQLNEKTHNGNFVANAAWFDYMVRNCSTKEEIDDILFCIVECFNGKFDYQAKYKQHAEYIETIKHEYKLLNNPLGNE